MGSKLAPRGYVVNTQFLDDEGKMGTQPIATDGQSNNEEPNANVSKSKESELDTTLTQPHHVNEEGHVIKHKGISWPLCALFLIADMAGGGIVAIPAAVQNTYFVPGVLICLFMAVIAMYTSILLGECWVILQKRYPEYRDFCRQVYAEIGLRAMGPWAKTFVSITIDVNQFGVSLIYLLLSAKSITEALEAAGVHFHYCFIIVILAAILTPVTFLKSPEDFWPAIFGAMACSLLSVVFIIVGSAMDYGSCKLSTNDMLSNFKRIDSFSTISALGTIVFSYGGHSSFPVILHDMRRPSHFTKSSYLAFGGISALYVPMAIVGFLAYGGNIHSSIINSIQTPWARHTVNAMILLHCIMAFLLVLNPLNLDIEERVNAPHHFGWHRVLVRSGIMVLITFLGLTVPNFGPILDLVGASATLLTVLIFPVIFYFYLNAAGNMHGETEKSTKLPIETSEKKTTKELIDEYPRPSIMQVIKHNNKRHLIVGTAVMALGVLICICASFSAIYDLVNTSFEMPCYVRWIKGDLATQSKSVFCCGLYGNVSAHHGDSCTVFTRK